MDQPEDLTLWSKYAQLLVQAGNYEGGIAALERLLLDPATLPGVRLEVAALYFRLGSYAMAETMVRTALADSRLQGEQRTLAVALLADVQKRNQRSQLSGNFVFGLRHQTNPTYRTDRGQVFSAGVLGPLAADQRPDAGNDLNLAVRLQHQYDLDLQNSAMIASTFGAALVDYRSSSGSRLEAGLNRPQDLGLLEFTTGVQFKPFPSAVSGLTLRPHILLSYLSAQRHELFNARGLGLDLAWRPNERTLLEMTLDGQERDFESRVDVRDAGLISGRLYGLRARLSRELVPGQVITGEVAARRNRTERDFYDYDSQEVRITYAFSYPSPVAKGGWWTTAVWLGGLRRSYDGPDAVVSAIETRKDREFRFGVSHTVPITPAWSLMFMADHARNSANLPNYRYKNTSVSGAIVRTF
ncbi:MAG: hypothetical protein EOO54_04985 [Haliea sp.]|nr:MAG: hypothetical protein EOO54_04985 [Haliea sp.]